MNTTIPGMLSAANFPQGEKHPFTDKQSQIAEQKTV
jgi:hypothetical protein